MVSILLAVMIAIVSGCTIHDMQWIKEDKSVIEPHTFAMDFYACRSVNEVSVEKQVFVTTEKDWFTYRSPKVNVQGMEKCLLEKGWKHP